MPSIRMPEGLRRKVQAFEHVAPQQRRILKQSPSLLAQEGLIKGFGIFGITEMEVLFISAGSTPEIKKVFTVWKTSS